MKCSSLSIGCLFFLCAAWAPATFAQTDELLVINDDLQLLPLAPGLYVHISWFENKEYGRFGSNGIVYIQEGKALIVDSPMKEELMVDLVAYVRDELKATVTLAVPGHFHDDCILGLPYLHSLGARSISGKLTRELCLEKGLAVPQQSFKRRKKLNFYGKKIQLAYFGGGHAPDNIVVWFPEEQVLFGGCMIRAMESNTLGNTGDAVLDQWSSTVGKVQKAFPDVKKVVPGHGQVGDGAMLQHTIDLTAVKK